MEPVRVELRVIHGSAAVFVDVVPQSEDQRGVCALGDEVHGAGDVVEAFVGFAEVSDG